MADYGIKVSKPGFDVLTTADKNLVFSSKFDTFRVFASGSGSITCTLGTVQTVTITHNLGYRPAFACYSELYDGAIPGVIDGQFLLPATDPVGGDGSIMPYVDTTTLKIRFGADIAPTNTVINYRYFIYYNQAI